MRKLLPFLYVLLLITCGNAVFAQSVDIYQKAGDGYLQDRNYQAAYDSYNLAIKKGTSDKNQLSNLYCGRGQSLNDLKRTDDAIKDFNRAISLNILNINAYWSRGVVYDGTGKFQLAIDDYKKAISMINPVNGVSALAILYCNLAYDQSFLGNNTEALAADSISLSLNGQYSRAFKVRGKIHLEQQKYALAIDDFTQAIFSFKDMNDVTEISFLYSKRADAKRYAKKYKDAINDYSLAIKINPANRVAYWNRAATYNDNGDYKLAADDYTTTMTYYNGDSTNLSKLYQDRASNEIGQMQLNNALKDDSLALTFNANNREAYFSLGIAYTQNGDYQKGIDSYQKLMNFYSGKDKLLALLYYQVANNEYFLNQFDKVVADCSKAIALNPEYAESYYYRAKVYYKKMNNKPLALADFNKVIALDTTKKTVGYIFSLFYTGKVDDATALLQNEVLTTTNNSQLLTDYYNLACLYSLANQADEANIYLKKAIDSGYSKKYAAADEDLDNIRNSDDYKAMIAGPSN